MLVDALRALLLDIIQLLAGLTQGSFPVITTKYPKNQ
jgi:hypothetical protein